MTHEETLDPQDWAALRALGHRALDDAMDYMESLRDRPAWEHAPARGEGALRRAAAGGAAAHRGHLPGVRRVRAAVPARQQPPALLGLGAGQRHADGGDRRDAGGGHRLRERHLLLREQQLRRAAGAGLVQGAARVPAGRRRAAHQRLLGLEPDRAGRGAQRRGRVRRAWGGAGGRARGHGRRASAPHHLLLGRGALVADQGRRAPRHGHELAAPRAHRRPPAHRPRGARRDGRARPRRRAATRLRRRGRRHHQHGVDRRPAGPRRLLRARGPLVPRGRRLRRLGRHRSRVAAPRRRDGARRLARLRPAQVDEPGVSRRLRAGPGRRGPAADLLADPVVPRPRRGRARADRGGRALALGLRVRALARLPRAQGVDDAQGARRRQVRGA